MEKRFLTAVPWSLQLCALNGEVRHRDGIKYGAGSGGIGTGGESRWVSFWLYYISCISYILYIIIHYIFCFLAVCLWLFYLPTCHILPHLATSCHILPRLAAASSSNDRSKKSSTFLDNSHDFVAVSHCFLPSRRKTCDKWDLWRPRCLGSRWCITATDDLEAQLFAAGVQHPADSWAEIVILCFLCPHETPWIPPSQNTGFIQLILW